VHVQYLNIIAKLPISWPNELTYAISKLRIIWSWIFLSPAALDCTLADNPRTSGADQAGIAGLIMLLMPLLMFSTVIVSRVIWWWIKPFACAVRKIFGLLLRCCRGVIKLPSDWHTLEQFIADVSGLCGTGRDNAVPCFREYFLQRTVITLLVATFFFYPATAAVAVGMNSCIDVCGEGYWILDMKLRCPRESVGQPQWQWAVGVGVPACIFCAVVPLFVATWLMRALRMRTLAAKDFVQYFGFLYSNYKTDIPIPEGGSLVKHLNAVRYRVNIAWDAVVHLQSLLLVFIGVYGTTWHEFYQTSALFTLLAAYLLMIVLFRPFRLPSIQFLQSACFAVLCFTCTCVLLLIKPDDMDSKQEANYTRAASVFAVLILVFNGVFLLGMFVLLIWVVLPCKGRAAAARVQATAGTHWQLV
jgi:hypothetical protein